MALVTGKYRPTAIIQSGTCSSVTAETLKIIAAVSTVSLSIWIRFHRIVIPAAG